MGTAFPSKEQSGDKNYHSSDRKEERMKELLIILFGFAFHAVLAWLYWKISIFLIDKLL